MASTAQQPLQPRKKPRQARSKATVEAILEGAAQVLVDVGYAKTTTTKVAARAGVSVGSLYQYFPSKDALVGALIERKFARVMVTIQAAEEASRGAGLEQRVRAIIGAVLETKAERPELGAVLAEQIPNTGGINYKAAMTGAAVGLVESMLREHREDIDVEDLRLAAYISVQAVEGVIGAAALDRSVEMNDPRLLDGLVRMVMGYIRPKPAARSARAGDRARGRGP